MTREQEIVEAFLAYAAVVLAALVVATFVARTALGASI